MDFFDVVVVTAILIDPGGDTGEGGRAGRVSIRTVTAIYDPRIDPYPVAQQRAVSTFVEKGASAVGHRIGAVRQSLRARARGVGISDRQGYGLSAIEGRNHKGLRTLDDQVAGLCIGGVGFFFGDIRGVSRVVLRLV